jgi:L-2,4-diaminobutyrate decarboxylase
MADFCEEHNLWFHVDAAHGGSAAFTEKYKKLVHGIERADSIVIDFHKMLMQPSLVTAVLFKNDTHSYQTFSQQASYLWDSNEKDWYNLGKRTFECTKNTMSLKVYTTLRTYGTKLFDENVTTLFDLGQKFADLIEQRNNFELAVPPESNIVCFRYKIKDDEKLNELNKKVRQLLIEEGQFFIVQTEINKKIFLRTCLMNPFTTEKVLISLLDRIEEITQKLIPID